MKKKFVVLMASVLTFAFVLSFTDAERNPLLGSSSKSR